MTENIVANHFQKVLPTLSFYCSQTF